MERPPLPEVPRLDGTRRAEMLAAQKASVAALRERMEARRGGKRLEERRRRPWWLLILLLLLLLALMCCVGPCAEPPEEVAEPEPIEVGEGAGTSVEPVRPPPTGAVTKRPRPSFPAVVPDERPWLSSYRMQVSARSTRLSGCFVGTTRPGVLRWTAQVEPGTGTVSDHELEPVLQSEQLSAVQRDCVIRVLSEPTYRLEGVEGAGPSRVGMILEF